MKVVLFEDRDFVNLLPLVYFRPVWELRVGAVTLQEKICRLLGSDCCFTARTYLTNYYLTPEKCILDWDEREDYLLINGRWVMDDTDLQPLNALKNGQALATEKKVLAFRGNGKSVRNCFLPDLNMVDSEIVLKKFQPVSHKATFIRYPWDAIELNGEEITRDFKRWANPGGISGRIEEGVHVLEKDRVMVAPTARIYPGVVIDATHGPVWIDDGATVMANAVLEGPLYIGQKSIIKIGAKIYENTSIGAVCKIGGEVEESIILDYSNKQHEGFLGHAYLGSWVNLGADTNNSDLKNNYGTVTVLVNGKPVRTGLQFVGLMMGDHSKCAINTMFNTGTVVGVNCNIFGAGMPPKFVPSFSWGGAEGLTAYQFEKALEVAGAVMARRQVAFTDKTAQLFRAVRDLAKTIEKGTLL